jgi:hypothetical protein
MMTPARTAPFPADWTVRRARDAYLAENGFTVEAYDAKWTDASFFGLRLVVPNTKRHRWAIMLHDIHHVATGYGTNLVGEGEISVWELRRGWRALGLYVSSIVLGGAVMGLLLSPQRAREAWRAAASTRTLFTELPSSDVAASYAGAYDALLDLTVAQLRDRLGVPREGVTRAPPGLHDYAPTSARI